MFVQTRTYELSHRKLRRPGTDSSVPSEMRLRCCLGNLAQLEIIVAAANGETCESRMALKVRIFSLTVKGLVILALRKHLYGRLRLFSWLTLLKTSILRRLLHQGINKPTTEAHQTVPGTVVICCYGFRIQT